MRQQKEIKDLDYKWLYEHSSGYRACRKATEERKASEAEYKKLLQTDNEQ